MPIKLHFSVRESTNHTPVFHGMAQFLSLNLTRKNQANKVYEVYDKFRITN